MAGLRSRQGSGGHWPRFGSPNRAGWCGPCSLGGGCSPVPQDPMSEAPASIHSSGSQFLGSREFRTPKLISTRPPLSRRPPLPRLIEAATPCSRQSPAHRAPTSRLMIVRPASQVVEQLEGSVVCSLDRRASTLRTIVRFPLVKCEMEPIKIRRFFLV